MKVWWGFDTMSVCMLAHAHESLWLKNHFQNHVKKIVPPSPAMGRAAPWVPLSALKRNFGQLNFWWCRAEMGARVHVWSGRTQLGTAHATSGAGDTRTATARQLVSLRTAAEARSLIKVTLIRDLAEGLVGKDVRRTRDASRRG